MRNEFVMDNFFDIRNTLRNVLIILILTQLYCRQKLEYAFEDPGVLFLGTAGKDAVLSPARRYSGSSGFS
jgi:hypothetical protein